MAALLAGLEHDDEPAAHGEVGGREAQGFVIAFGFGIGDAALVRRFGAALGDQRFFELGLGVARFTSSSPAISLCGSSGGVSTCEACGDAARGKRHNHEELHVKSCYHHATRGDCSGLASESSEEGRVQTTCSSTSSVFCSPHSSVRPRLRRLSPLPRLRSPLRPASSPPPTSSTTSRSSTRASSRSPRSSSRRCTTRRSAPTRPATARCGSMKPGKMRWDYVEQEGRRPPPSRRASSRTARTSTSSSTTTSRS